MSVQSVAHRRSEFSRRGNRLASYRRIALHSWLPFTEFYRDGDARRLGRCSGHGTTSAGAANVSVSASPARVLSHSLQAESPSRSRARGRSQPSPPRSCLSVESAPRSHVCPPVARCRPPGCRTPHRRAPQGARVPRRQCVRLPSRGAHRNSRRRRALLTMGRCGSQMSSTTPLPLVRPAVLCPGRFRPLAESGPLRQRITNSAGGIKGCELYRTNTSYSVRRPDQRHQACALHDRLLRRRIRDSVRRCVARISGLSAPRSNDCS